jgi:plasmid maintenance system antidote protein VapI
MSFLINRPGAILRAAIEGRGITNAECAQELKSSERAIQAIIDGSARMTPSLAFRAAHYFGTSALLWLNSILLWGRFLEEKKRQTMARDEESLRAVETERILQMSEAIADIFSACRPNPSSSEIQKGGEGARFLGEMATYHDESLATVAERTVLYEGVAALVAGSILAADNDLRLNCLTSLAVHDVSSFEVMAVAATLDGEPRLISETVKMLSLVSPGLCQSRSLAILMDKSSSEDRRRIATELILSVLPYYEKQENENARDFEARLIEGESWWIRNFIRDASGFSAIALAPFVRTSLQPSSGVAWEDSIEVLIARHTRLASHILIAGAKSPISDIRVDSLTRLFALDHPWAEEMAKQLSSDPDKEVARCADRLWRCYGT